MNDWHQHLCAQMKAHRKALKLTQAQAAEALGQNQSAWHHWEAGTREPSLTNLYKIARVLQCSIHELLPPQSQDLED